MQLHRNRNKLIRSDRVYTGISVHASLGTYDQKPVLTPFALAGIPCKAKGRAPAE